MLTCNKLPQNTTKTQSLDLTKRVIESACCFCDHITDPTLIIRPCCVIVIKHNRKCRLSEITAVLRKKIKITRHRRCGGHRRVGFHCSGAPQRDAPPLTDRPRPRIRPLTEPISGPSVTAWTAWLSARVGADGEGRPGVRLTSTPGPSCHLRG